MQGCVRYQPPNKKYHPHVMSWRKTKNHDRIRTWCSPSRLNKQNVIMHPVVMVSRKPRPSLSYSTLPVLVEYTEHGFTRLNNSSIYPSTSPENHGVLRNATDTAMAQLFTQPLLLHGEWMPYCNDPFPIEKHFPLPVKKGKGNVKVEEHD